MGLGKLSIPARVERAASRLSGKDGPRDEGLFAEEVRALRASLSLTQEGFCERYHIPISNLRNWEQANRNVVPDAAARLLIAMIKVDPSRVAKLVARTRESEENEVAAL